MYPLCCTYTPCSSSRAGEAGLNTETSTRRLSPFAAAIVRQPETSSPTGTFVQSTDTSIRSSVRVVPAVRLSTIHSSLAEALHCSGSRPLL